MKNIALLLLGIIFIACMGCRGGLVTLKKGNLTAQGSSKGSEAEIFEIEIGNAQAPFDGRFAFSIRLDSGRVVTSDLFTLALIQSIATRTNVPSPDEWGAGDVNYGVEGCRFTFTREKLVQFSASRILLPQRKVLSTTLGDASAKKFFGLPLTITQFKILFGEPESKDRRTVL